jgi:hypothetical protein
VEARVEVELLEGRALMAYGAYSVVNTLIAKDNILLEAIYVRQTIQQNQINNLTQLSTTISDGQRQTQAIAVDFQGWFQQLLADRAAGNASGAAIAQQHLAQDLFIGSQVRSWMRIAVASSQTTQGQLLKDQAIVNQAFTIATNYLARGYSPSVVQTQAIAAIDYIGHLSQQHYTSGWGSQVALDTLINNAFTAPPTDD